MNTPIDTGRTAVVEVQRSRDIVQIQRDLLAADSTERVIRASTSLLQATRSYRQFEIILLISQTV